MNWATCAGGGLYALELFHLSSGLDRVLLNIDIPLPSELHNFPFVVLKVPPMARLGFPALLDLIEPDKPGLEGVLHFPDKPYLNSK